MKAVWNGIILADSNKTIVVDGRHYFPPDSLNSKYFVESTYTSHSSVRGLANYYSIRGESGEILSKRVSFTYRYPPPSAAKIQNYVAFRKDVQVVKHYRKPRKIMNREKGGTDEKTGARRPRASLICSMKGIFSYSNRKVDSTDK